MISASSRRTRRRFLGCALLAIGASTTFATVQSSAAERVEGQILVRWRSLPSSVLPANGNASSVARAPQALQNAMMASLPGTRVRRTFAATGWSLVQLAPGESTDAALARLRARFGAANVQSNTKYYPSALPNDPGFGSQPWLSRINAPAAWDKTTGVESNGPIVAVIDSGAQLEHPDLKPNLWVNAGEVAGNGVDDDGNGYVDDIHGITTVFDPDTGEDERGQAPEDSNGHGTHIAGILGAVGNNAQGVTGLNWRLRIMPLRFIGSGGYGTDASIIEALEYVIKMKRLGHPIRVTSNSYSGSTPNSALDDAFRAAGGAGILNVCAAGNNDLGSGLNIDRSPQYPASQNEASIISVAATDEGDNLATYSNFGPKSVDIAAPGSDILSLGLDGGTSFQSGTSMSTPMVAGAAALLLSLESGLTPVDLKARLIESADKLPQLNGRIALGARLNVGTLVAGANQGFAVGGQVFGTAGGVRSPLAGAAIKIGKRIVAYSDLNGRYQINDLQSGTHALSATYKGFTFRAVKLPVTTRGLTRHDFEGVGKGRFYTIAGRAIGPNGQGMAGVEIFNTLTAPTPLAVTDANGDYRIDNRVAGTYRLTARGAGLSWTPAPVAIKLPLKKGLVAPNGVVDFLAPPSAAAASAAVAPSSTDF